MLTLTIDTERLTQYLTTRHPDVEVHQLMLISSCLMSGYRHKQLGKVANAMRSKFPDCTPIIDDVMDYMVDNLIGLDVESA